MTPARACNLAILLSGGSYLFVVPEMKIADIAISVELDEVAHNEPPHLDLHCLSSSL